MQSISSWDFAAVGVGEWKPTGGGTMMSALASVAGAGAVSATIVIEVTNNPADPNGSIPMFTLAPSGTTGGANDSKADMASWPWARARCTAISGTGAKVQASLSVGG